MCIVANCAEGEFELVQFGDFWHLDTSAVAWTRLDAQSAGGGAAPGARSGHVMAAVGKSLYLHGGFASAGGFGRDGINLADTWVYSTTDLVWIKLDAQGEGASPSARARHVMVVLGNTLWLHGGMQQTDAYGRAVTVTTPKRRLDDTWIFDTASHNWTRVESKSAGAGAPSARSDHIVAAVGTEALCIHGGSSGSGNMRESVCRVMCVGWDR